MKNKIKSFKKKEKKHAIVMFLMWSINLLYLLICKIFFFGGKIFNDVFFQIAIVCNLFILLFIYTSYNKYISSYLLGYYNRASEEGGKIEKN